MVREPPGGSVIKPFSVKLSPLLGALMVAAPESAIGLLIAITPEPGLDCKVPPLISMLIAPNAEALSMLKVPLLLIKTVPEPKAELEDPVTSSVPPSMVVPPE